MIYYAHSTSIFKLEKNERKKEGKASNEKMLFIYTIVSIYIYQ